MRVMALTTACGWVLLLIGCMPTAGARPPTVLQIMRPPLVAHQQTVAGLDRTLTDAAGVQRLYTAVLALPDAHQFGYPLPCPNDLGLTYHLTFLDGTSPLQQADVQVLGCHWVDLSPSDVRRADQAFLDLLANTLELSSLVPAGLLP